MQNRRQSAPPTSPQKKGRKLKHHEKDEARKRKREHNDEDESAKEHQNHIQTLLQNLAEKMHFINESETKCLELTREIEETWKQLYLEREHMRVGCRGRGGSDY